MILLIYYRVVGIIMKKIDRKYFTLFDIGIIVVVLIVSAVCLFSQLNRPTDNLTCVVKVSGEQVYRVSLDSIDDTTEYRVDTQYPLTVIIGSDSVRVVDAHCPDKLCEHSGTITRAGQSIVCLPSKVSVTLISNNSTLDAVVG